MVRFALFDYYPQRRIRRASFDILDMHRMILGFKDGRNVYTSWAARQFASAVSHMDMHDVAIVCVPASTRYSHVRRWKRFSSMLCEMTGAVNGFDRVLVSGTRRRAHVVGEYDMVSSRGDSHHGCVPRQDQGQINTICFLPWFLPFGASPPHTPAHREAHGATQAGLHPVRVIRFLHAVSAPWHTALSPGCRPQVRRLPCYLACTAAPSVLARLPFFIDGTIKKY